MTAEYAPEYEPEPDPIQDALDLITTGTESLGREVADDTTDPQEAVSRLHRIRAARKALAEVEAYVESHTVPLLDYGKQEVGPWLVEIRGGAKRNEWDHDRLAWDATRDLALIDGAIEDERAAVVDLVRSRLMNCARLEWRMTPLKELGLNPNDYATVTYGRRTVQVTPLAEVEE